MSAPRLPTKTIPVPLSESASCAAVIGVPSCGTLSAAVVARRGRANAHASASQYAFAPSGGDFGSCISERGDEFRNSLRRLIVVLGASALIVVFPGTPQSANAEQPIYDITTLAGKVASVNGTAGLQIRFSSFIEQEAAEEDSATAAAPITPGHVLSSPLDGTSVAAPAVTVNRDTAGAPQNETAIAVDPNNPNRIVAAANDYVARTWSCSVSGTPCSALADAYSGTYFSNDGGKTWCCSSSDPAHLGTLIPGVERLTGGQYDAGGDPSVTFDSRGRVYYAGLGFNRASPPNAVAVNRGTFDAAGNLTWGPPTFVAQTTAPSHIDDKEWIAADKSPTSPFRDRVYVTFTRFIFNPVTGAYVQSPIMIAVSKDNGATFSDPAIVGAPAIFSQGSRPLVAPDGTLYVIFSGSPPNARFNSTWIAKSTDGGATFAPPVKIADRLGATPPNDAAFRMNSFPSGVVAPDGTLYVAWTAKMNNSATAYSIAGFCLAPATNADCHESAVFSRSTDKGATWSTPRPINPALDASTRTPDGYVDPVEGTPPVRRVDTFWAGLTATPGGTIYSSYYAADVESPRRVCARVDPATGACAQFIFVNNARLDYFATNLTTGTSRKLTAHPINPRYSFAGFIGDYTDLAAGSDGVFHALWADTNAKQRVHWFFGTEFTAPNQPVINQQDVAVFNGSF